MLPPWQACESRHNLTAGTAAHRCPPHLRQNAAPQDGLVTDKTMRSLQVRQYKCERGLSHTAVQGACPEAASSRMR
jgi:hypothetical protein